MPNIIPQKPTLVRKENKREQKRYPRFAHQAFDLTTVKKLRPCWRMYETDVAIFFTMRMPSPPMGRSSAESVVVFGELLVEKLCGDGY